MENWAELGKPFEEFNEQITQVWIDNNFTSEATKEWLEVGFIYNSSYLIAWLKDQENITINDWKDLNDDQQIDLLKQFIQYCEDKNLVYCDWCYKCIDKSLTTVVDLEDEKFLCLKNCQTEWNYHYFKQERLDRNNEKVENKSKFILISIFFTTIIAIFILTIRNIIRKNKNL
ncbi:MAG: hypothetical protein AM1032_000023 [Mycoplasmataceae bacterium]|nr:MAG: hypothetical protein AM1032_000023 [Mycoplasmataceae bacterium]